ncbi:MAG: MlaE family lipid ABC transporter permease subunit [Gallionella sp.]|jgi:phospholipid/cholesterol/gamma-HCH transport system permease protein
MKHTRHADHREAQLRFEADSIFCTGSWTTSDIASLEHLLRQTRWPPGDITFDCSALSALDTSGAYLLLKAVHTLEQQERQITLSGLKPEFTALLQLVDSSANNTAQPPKTKDSLLFNIGKFSIGKFHNLSGMLAFIGMTALSLFQSVSHPQRIRFRPILHNLQSAGFDALPIVGLLSFLMGLVIAYQGADQLQRFGANIFIADLVGLSMVRELSPLMTAIIVAGRSGSAYTAQIGTMKVTEEIDALRTIGISPTELLVLPKLIALIIALPLLTVFADLTGLLGGMLMASSKLDVSYAMFIDRLGDAVHLSSFLTGIGKAPVFAAIIALVGCYQGFQVTGSADSVGRQTTVSVVQGIFLVILSDALFSIAFNWLKI